MRESAAPNYTVFAVCRMPKMADVLTALAPVLTALIGAGGVLIATRQSNSNNRNLKLIELEDQNERTKRQEKREAYLELLRTYRMLVQYMAQISHTDLGQQFQTDVASVHEVNDRLNRLFPELEIAGSEEVKDVYQEISAAADECNRVLYEETEKRFAAFEQRGIAPTSQQKAAIWNEVSAEIRKVYEGMGVERLYAQLRTLIQKELGFASSDTPLTPTAEEQAKLHEQVLKLDHMKLRAGQHGSENEG